MDDARGVERVAVPPGVRRTELSATAEKTCSSPAAGLRASAPVAHRAGAACLSVELDDDDLGRSQGGGAQLGAGAPAWAGGLPLVPVEVNAVRSNPAPARAWGELFIRTGGTRVTPSSEALRHRWPLVASSVLTDAQWARIEPLLPDRTPRRRRKMAWSPEGDRHDRLEVPDWISVDRSACGVQLVERRLQPSVELGDRRDLGASFHHPAGPGGRR